MDPPLRRFLRFLLWGLSRCPNPGRRRVQKDSPVVDPRLAAMAPVDSVLDLGKHKGMGLAGVSDEHLVWLTGRFVSVKGRRVVIHERDSDAVRWLHCHKPHIVVEARQLARERRRCLHCGRALAAFRQARENGKDRPDWEGRLFHKKCWRTLTA